jgi:hypothetical protein
VTDGNAEPLGGDCTGISRVRVALDQDHIRALGSDDRDERFGEARDHRVGPRIVDHGPKPEVGVQPEILERLVEQRTMLAGGEDAVIDTGAIGGGEGDRRYLDRFRACSHDAEQPDSPRFHVAPLSVRGSLPSGWSEVIVNWLRFGAVSPKAWGAIPSGADRRP